MNDPNLAILSEVAQMLAPLLDEVVFLGGCATGLLLTDPAAPGVRPTDDVDVISEVATLGEYYRLADRLKGLGFREDTSPEAPLCRWTAQGRAGGRLILDAMPTEPGVLGFSNRWYATAIRTSHQLRLASGHVIRVIAAPHFVATKLEAFYGRGTDDHMASHDLEDVVTLVDGRAELQAEVAASDTDIRTYLAKHFARLLASERFVEALPGYLLPDPGSQARLATVRHRLEQIAAIG